MGQTIIEKIISRNVGHEVKPGDIVTVHVDRVMIHDIFIPFVAEKFEEMGFTRLWDPDKVVLIYDHLVPASQVDDTRHFRIGNEFVEKYVMKNIHRSDGICHQLMTEADGKNRDIGRIELFDFLNDALAFLGIPRAVAEHDAVWLGGEDFLRTGTGRVNGHFAAPLLEGPGNILLGAQIQQSHALLFAL